MQLEAVLPVTADARTETARLERLGIGTMWVPEAGCDPFVRVAAAGTTAETIRLGTGVAIAFGRSPLTVAHSGYDLAGITRGRFVLGLGSQVRGHIERRYSMPWSEPVARMREFVAAVRAIWSAWTTDAPLAFRGRFYRHDLMTPAFMPPGHEYGRPPIYPAGVSTKMTELAGEIADGYVLHPFTSEHYLHSVTIPALARGRSDGEGQRPFSVAGSMLVGVATTEREMEAAHAGLRRSIAFYGATAAYAPVLAAHDLADLQQRLTVLARSGDWDAMASLVPDELVRTIAVVGAPAEMAREVRRRCRGAVDGLALLPTRPLDPSIEAEIMAGFAALQKTGEQGESAEHLRKSAHDTGGVLRP